MGIWSVIKGTGEKRFQDVLERVSPHPEIIASSDLNRLEEAIITTKIRGEWENVKAIVIEIPIVREIWCANNEMVSLFCVK